MLSLTGRKEDQKVLPLVGGEGIVMLNWSLCVEVDGMDDPPNIMIYMCWFVITVVITGAW